MANVNEMAANIRANMIERYGEDLVNEVESLGIESRELAHDNVRMIDASVFFLGIRDAKNGVFDLLETGYCSEAFDDAYLAGWKAYLIETNCKKKQFKVKNVKY